jgi:glutathione synthase
MMPPVRTLFVMDALEHIHVEGDSTFILMLEACRRGWPIWMCTPDDLFVCNGRAHARAMAVQVTEASPHFHADLPDDVDLADMDVVWMRKDPPFDIHYIFATYILDLEPATTVVLNDPRSIRNASEKMFAMQFSEFAPETLVTKDLQRIMRFAAQAPGRVVLKPWDGNGGRGVLVSRHGDPNLRSMAEILTQEGKVSIIVQHYIPEIKEGDKRIILIDGEPVGQMLRVPGESDHRGNMHVGASVQACELTDTDRAVCARIGPTLREMGLLFVGIDTIGPYLTEINVTSPTGIREINRLMGTHLERTLTDAVVDRVRDAKELYA